MRKESGFTLAELMVVLAIGAILMAMAVPAARDFIQSAQMTNATNELVRAINLARTESAKRGVPVYLTAIATGDAANEWGNGWRVWLDSDGDAVFQAGEKELHLADPLGSGITLDSVNDRTQFKYFPSGRVDAGDTFNLCDQRSGTTDREIVVNAAGRSTVETKNLCP